MAKVRVEVVVDVPDELLRLLLPAADHLDPGEVARLLPRVLELELHDVGGKAVLRVLPSEEALRAVHHAR